MAEDGCWREVSSLPASGSDGTNHPSHLELTAGSLLYVANRAPDTLSVFRAESGRLTRVAEVGVEGRWPRHFAIAGDRRYAANERSGEVVAFTLRDGTPAPTGHALPVTAPSCVLPWSPPAPSG